MGDQLPLRMAGQPSRSGADELVHLVVTDPIMFGIVEYRQQDVEVIECRGQTKRSDEGQGHERRITPIGSRGIQLDGLGGDSPTHGFEKAAQQGGIARDHR